MFAAFSVGLVISALMGPRAGRAIDTSGGRPVLGLSNLVGVSGPMDATPHPLNEATQGLNLQ